MKPNLTRRQFVRLVGVGTAAAAPPQIMFGGETRQTKPNVLFTAVDDLNDWTGRLGGHPGQRAPTLDCGGVESLDSHWRDGYSASHNHYSTTSESTTRSTKWAGPACSSSRCGATCGTGPPRSLSRLALFPGSASITLWGNQGTCSNAVNKCPPTAKS